MNSFGWHLITGEYPPQTGGVSDHTYVLATSLAAAGDEVHVWCPSPANVTEKASKVEVTETEGVFVHRELGGFSPADLRRMGRLLDQFAAPRRLLVQWVPHGYGYRSMNLPFCLWLWNRAVRRRDAIEVMIHEPYLSFGEGSWKQACVAVVHRLMTIVLLNAASRVWVTIPAWEEYLRPYALGRKLDFGWLPVASNIPVVEDAGGVEAVRTRYGPADGFVVGHFGTYDWHIKRLLLSYVPALLQNGNKPSVLLLGRGSELMRNELICQHPEIANRVQATGELQARDLSLHVSACDVMLQPYIDGVSSRRTSTMVALAHGVPVVTTKGILTESLWAESEAVALAPVADLPALVKTIQRLLPDAASRKRMSAAARALYAERFDVTHTTVSLREAGANQNGQKRS